MDLVGVVVGVLHAPQVAAGDEVGDLGRREQAFEDDEAVAGEAGQLVGEGRRGGHRRRSSSRGRPRVNRACYPALEEVVMKKLVITLALVAVVGLSWRALHPER